LSSSDSNSCSTILILEHLDCFDLGGSIRDKTTTTIKSNGSQGGSSSSSSLTGRSLPSSISEKVKRIFWLEFTAAFRKASKMKNCFWIATVSNESNLGQTKIETAIDSQNSSSIFSKWFNFSISLPESPEFSQRMEIFNRYFSSGEIQYKEVEIKNQLVIPTHQWSIGEIYERCDFFAANEYKTVEQLSNRIKYFTNLSSLGDTDLEIPKVFGMSQDLQVIQDSCILPLCRVAKELKEGTRSFDLVQNSENNNNNQIFLPKGILVVGPAGCGKSHLLKSIAAQITRGSAGGVAVILQDTLSLVQKEVGVTELNIHNLFEQARSAAPCVLLLDHIDSIASPRNASAFADSSSQVADRMLSTLLVEMDGVKKSERDKFVIVVATAPALEKLDPAVRRPGRLDIHVEVRHPKEQDVFDMLMDGLRPTFEGLLLLVSSDEKNYYDREIESCVREKSRELLLSRSQQKEEEGDTEEISYADVQSWYREKVSKLVSKWIMMKNSNENLSSFTKFEEWETWMMEE
jgi:hypothetical protein